jgi:DNA-directed RNA polymerase specialized sigma24 family protein
MKTSFPPYLSERHKTAIRLREMRRFGFRQIGEELGVSEGSSSHFERRGRRWERVSKAGESNAGRRTTESGTVE